MARSSHQPNRLFAFRRFAHDAQGVLTAVHQFGLVGIKLRLNIDKAGRLELRITSFTDADGWRALLHNSELALMHDCSLAQLAGRA
jgi:hypothetical protein